MRVLVIGGTKYIGRRITEELVRRGDEVMVVHRGGSEPEDWVGVRHLHTDRARFAEAAGDVAAFAPEGVVDTYALTAADAEAVLPHLPAGAALVVLSSMDVYRAFETLHEGRGGEPLPLTEDSALRVGRYPYRGRDLGRDLDLEHYEKIDVEERYLARGATVLRLPMVYGEHDGQRREEFVLRRVRAGRTRIPIGAANWLWTRVYVGDVATAVAAALREPAARGGVFNIGEPVTGTFRDWIEAILDAAGHRAELVTVPEEALPPDLAPTGAVAQHLLVSSERARRVLGWTAGDPGGNIRRSVRWHLDHPPPAQAPTGPAAAERPADPFAADDRALALADAGRAGAAGTAGTVGAGGGEEG
ncbi:NAD-dependent epimerase/dehydratase family protein [Allostreptomyces psammosilenae]|uniref:Nucleoside-diphosphate-sugar epimerase n=1 Tax=Allostreptomyces psammosilenae TaxID=1892865 RepID=A0A853A664_9ACTN|nr:NAD-dependent epimerase/dehydratase family protein [Allostreptomyces psammosilenae]NYI06028.1 nucleoside-diphosphate-sugar epimerase [Allostreptomyces psammosilenae]